MNVSIRDIYIGEAAELTYDRRLHLSTVPFQPLEMEKIDFLKVHDGIVMVELEETLDDQDGEYYWALIGFFVNGVEVRYVTDWLSNSAKKRVAVYALEVPKSALRLTGKPVEISVKVGKAKRFFQKYLAREYTSESGRYYLRLTDKQGAYA